MFLSSTAVETRPNSEDKSVVGACAAFRLLEDPKDSAAFEALIQHPLQSPADVAALLTTVADACEAHVGNRDSAGPAVVHRICKLAQDATVNDMFSAAQWCRCVWLLTNLPGDGWVPLYLRDKNTAAFVADGGAAMLLTLMDRLVADEAVCHWGCRALTAVARYKCMPSKLLPAGILDRIYAAMAAHPASAAVHQEACSVLLNIVSALNGPNNAQLVSGGACVCFDGGSHGVR